MNNIILETPLKVTNTKHGRLIMLPPVREATEQDRVNLHRLIARLLFEDYQMLIGNGKV